jgi:hypothetical protein
MKWSEYNFNKLTRDSTFIPHNKRKPPLLIVKLTDKELESLVAKVVMGNYILPCAVTEELRRRFDINKKN